MYAIRSYYAQHPDAQVAIDRAAGDESTVAAKGDRKHAAWILESADLLAIRRIPNPHRSVQAARGDERAVGVV